MSVTAELLILRRLQRAVEAYLDARDDYGVAFEDTFECVSLLAEVRAALAAVQQARNERRDLSQPDGRSGA